MGASSVDGPEPGGFNLAVVEGLAWDCMGHAAPAGSVANRCSRKPEQGAWFIGRKSERWEGGFPRV